MAHAAEINIQDLIDQKPDLVVISPNDPKAMNQYVRECHELNIPYLYDPSQQIVRLDPADLRSGVEGAHSLFVNEYEFELLQKHTGLTAARSWAWSSFLVVTLGKKGAIVYVEGEEYHIPAVRTGENPRSDRGGGCLPRRVPARLTAWDWIGRLAGRWVRLAATYCLEQRGTQSHHYTPAEFVDPLPQQFR